MQNVQMYIQKLFVIRNMSMYKKGDSLKQIYEQYKMWVIANTDQ